MANGSSKHGDALADAVRDEFEVLRHHREKVVEDLREADDEDRDSSVAIEAIKVARAAIESKHDQEEPVSRPPDMPWHVRVLPPRFRWIAALLAMLLALATAVQALSMLQHAQDPPHRAP